jgi:hypothetical protein
MWLPTGKKTEPQTVHDGQRDLFGLLEALDEYHVDTVTFSGYRPRVITISTVTFNVRNVVRIFAIKGKWLEGLSPLKKMQSPPKTM